MDINTLAKILEKGGQISWRSKYFLIFEENWNVNPNKKWSGYSINQLDWCQYYTSFYKNQNLSETLDKFYELIKEEINHK